MLGKPDRNVLNDFSCTINSIQLVKAESQLAINSVVVNQLFVDRLYSAYKNRITSFN